MFVARGMGIVYLGFNGLGCAARIVFFGTAAAFVFFSSNTHRINTLAAIMHRKVNAYYRKGVKQNQRYDTCFFHSSNANIIIA